MGAHHDTAPGRARRLRRRRRRGRADRGRARPGRGAAAAAHHRVRLVGRRGGVVHGADDHRRLAGLRARPGARRRATWSPRWRWRCAAGAGARRSCIPSPMRTRCGRAARSSRPPGVMRAALGGSRRAGVALGVGDPYLSWLYQPAVRTFRVRLYGDDLSFLQAGLPAIVHLRLVLHPLLSLVPPADRHRRTSSTRRRWRGWGRAVVGATLALAALPATRVAERDWFAAFGYVAGAPVLWVAGLAALVPGPDGGAPRRRIALRGAHAPRAARGGADVAPPRSRALDPRPARADLGPDPPPGGAASWRCFPRWRWPRSAPRPGRAGWSRGSGWARSTSRMVLAGLAPAASFARARRPARCARASRTAARGAPRGLPGDVGPDTKGRIRRAWTRCSKATSRVSRCRTSSPS